MPCASCGEDVKGKYVEALGAEWHPVCFACTSCMEPIAAGFLARDEKPYHSDCFHKIFSPQCAGCGKALGNSYLTALGRAWHPEHFRCERCGKPFAGSFYEHKGKAYCSDDYYELFSPRCDVCGKAMTGEFAKNGWGDKFCRRHERDLSSCHSCSRPISPKLTGGGATYKDGRAQCNICRRAGVDSQDQATAILSHVRRKLVKVGIDLGEICTPVKLSDANELKQKAMGSHVAHPSGLAVTRTVMRGGKEAEREVVEIRILLGIPQWHFEAVASHELAHVWLFMNRFPRLSPKVEEGICELVSYLYLGEEVSAEASWLRTSIESKQDPIYGCGFRDVYQALEGRTLHEMLTEVWRHAKLPKALARE